MRTQMPNYFFSENTKPISIEQLIEVAKETFPDLAPMVQQAKMNLQPTDMAAVWETPQVNYHRCTIEFDCDGGLCFLIALATKFDEVRFYGSWSMIGGQAFIRKGDEISEVVKETYEPISTKNLADLLVKFISLKTKILNNHG